MSFKARLRRWMRGRGTGVRTVVLMMAITAPAWLQAGTWSLDDARIVAGGGISASAGGCLSVSATLGQDTLGSSTGGDYSLSAGLWPGSADQRTDALFHHGFEECQ